MAIHRRSTGATTFARGLDASDTIVRIATTRHLGVIHHVSDDNAIMRAGEVVEYGPADAVFDDPQHPYTRELLDAVPRIPLRAV